MVSLVDSCENIKKSKSKTSLATISSVQFKNLFKASASNQSIRRKSSVKCTQNVIEKSGVSVKCPRCQFTTTISIGGLNRLPRHLLLQRKVKSELIRLENEIVSCVQCQQCEADKAVISA